MQKKLLIIAATHGDEKIGIEVIKKLKEINYQKYFDFMIGNPKAEKKNRRFLEKDLNRSYPGNSKSKFYEERLAVKNLKKAKQYKFIIDIHEADQGKDDFIIAPIKNLPRFPLSWINLEKILLWPDPKGPLGQVFKNCIELEFGIKNKNYQNLCDKAFRIVKNFIDNMQKFDLEKMTKSKKSQTKQVFFVYGKLTTKKFSNKKIILKDFQKTKIGQENFYPLLVDQYKILGIKCYKMRKR